MWPFKSPDRRFREALQGQYGPYLLERGFIAEPEVPGRPAHLWGLQFRSLDFRLRINAERSQPELLVNAAPLHPTGAWYEADWYLLYNVVKWLKPEVVVDPKWTVGPSPDVLNQVHEALVRFFSPEGATQREQFIESTTWPPGRAKGLAGAA